ncbi:MAG: hypothetical protein WBB64_14195 [Anaerolineales bacterium]
MNKRNWVLKFLTLLFCGSVLISAGCTKPTDEEKLAMTAAVEVMAPDTPVGEAEKPPDTPLPPPWTFVDTYGLDSMIALDEYTNIIGLEDSDKQKLDVRIDIEGNNVWAGGLDVEGIPPSAEPYSDIVFTARGTFDYPPDYTDLPVNGMHTCGYYNYEVPTWVSCPQGLDTTGITRWHVLYVGFGDTVPLNHDTRYGTVALAMILANDPLGIYIPHPEFPQDHFGGTNVWLINQSAPGEVWESNAYDSGWNPINVDFFTAFYKNIAAFYVSAADVELEYPFGRPTCDWADPNDWQNSFSGDTEFGDATIDPTQWGIGSQIFMQNKPKAVSFLPEGYYLCGLGIGGCRFNYGGGGEEDNVMASCECVGCTNQAGCDCALFRKDKYYGGFTFRPMNEKPWEYVADANQITLLDPKANYNCICVSE